MNIMELIPRNEVILSDENCYYIPHHFVLKPNSTATKLRTVFDGSCITTSGVSLNDILSVTPKILNDF